MRLAQRVRDDDPALPEALTMGLMGLGDAHVAALAEALKTNTRVTKLNLWRNGDVTDAGGRALLDMLRANTAVRAIGLDGCRRMSGLMQAEVKFMADDPRRRTLAERLADDDPALPETLDLRGNSGMGLTDAHVAALAEALKTNTRVTELKLYNNKAITDAGGRALLDMLRANTAVRKIELDDCEGMSGAVRGEVGRLAKDPARGGTATTPGR